MHLASRKSLLLAACLLVAGSFASAEVITFNSLPGNGTPIPNGFAGLDWNNFYDMNGHVLLTPALMTPPGAIPPVSGAFAYNHDGGPATFSAPNTFTFNSAWLASDGPTPISLEVIGLLDGKAVDSMTLVLYGTVPVQETFNWSGIDSVRFMTQTSASSVPRLQFALSEMVINSLAVPEPTSTLLLGSGVGLAIARLRKLRLSK